MLEARTYWTVLCSRCGVDAFEGGEFSAYSDQESAVETVRERGDWLLEGGRHYCGECVVWDDDLDELVVKTGEAC